MWTNLLLQFINMVRAASQVGLQNQTKSQRHLGIVQLRLEMPKQVMAYSLVSPGPCKQEVSQGAVQMALIL